MSRTIAHAVTAAGLPDVLRKLKSLGADLNLEDDDGNTPLWDAAYRGQAECVRTLLDAGANPDGYEERLDDGDHYHPETPLAVAANAEIAKKLLDSGASMSLGMYSNFIIENKMQRQIRIKLISSLARACLDGREDTTRCLLVRGADANALDGQAMRCLVISEKPSVRLLDALIRPGADVNCPEGNEPLLLAALTGNGEMCARLLKAGANPVPEALPLAVHTGKLACLEVLLKHREGRGSEAIHTAAREN